jgi:hypothetical protein
VLRPRRRIYADQTLNPSVAAKLDISSHRVLANELYEFRDLRLSSKYRSFEMFLKRARGDPGTDEVGLAAHALTQVVQLLAADAIATGSPVRWRREGDGG